MTSENRLYRRYRPASFLLSFYKNYSSAALCCLVVALSLGNDSVMTRTSATTIMSSSSSSRRSLLVGSRIQRHNRWIKFETKNAVLSSSEEVSKLARVAFRMPRGGSTDWVSDDEESDEEEESEEETVNEASSVEAATTAPTFSEPITVTIKTNIMASQASSSSSLIDHSMELLVTPSRTVGSVKQTLSRQLPGRPPVSLLRLVHDSQVLNDDEVMQEIVEDDEEEDDDDESSTRGLVLLLDIAPPVDSKFAVDGMHKIVEMSTMELLEAYAANAAAMNANGQALVGGDGSSSRGAEEQDTMGSSLQSVTLRQQALKIRQQLESQYTPAQLEEWKVPPKPAGEITRQVERRGQRVRSGPKGGARTSMKVSLQRNLNINWADTVRNFLLFLFFGLFGGRSLVSRNLLLLGAPLCFVLQARPVKILLKQAFYACHDPPSILLSLLPAPEQAILSFQYNDALKELYGSKEEKEGRKDELEQDELDDESSDEDEDSWEADDESDEDMSDDDSDYDNDDDDDD